MSGYNRPEGGWRFDFRGIKINDAADAIPAFKSPFARNIRATLDNSIQTRPGYVLDFGAAGIITDINTYTAIETDNLPRVLVRNVSNQIYLDNGALVTTLAGNSLGVFMIPYRPNQSPQAWMYIGSQNDYQKLSAPDGANNVLAYKTGIKEQQAAPETCPDAFNFYDFSGVAADWTQGGTAGAPSDTNRLTDTLGSVLEDPASGTIQRCSCVVTSTEQYQLGMEAIVDTTIAVVVQDILPPINDGTAITIDSIYYLNGTSGRCVIVPTQLPTSPSIPTVKNNLPIAASIYADSVVSALRRGSVINLDNGADPDEDLFVLSVTTGPGGTVCFEVITAATYSSGDSITGLPAISLSNVTSANTGDAIIEAAIDSTLTGAGTGTLSQALATNPFNQPLAPSTNTPQQDDYIAFSINISDLSKFVNGKVIFNTEPGAPGYDTNGFYAQFDASVMVFHQPAASQTTTQTIIEQSVDFDGNIIDTPITITTTTPLPSDQWTTVMFPVRALTRLGNDLTKTLSSCNGIQVSVQTTDTILLRIGAFWIGGGGQPDVGNNGVPYFYSVIGRNSATGALSNPSPITRYGVSPRRQSVNVIAIDDVHDPQMDIWDVYRYGGTITSMRRIGSMPNTGGTDIFTDNYFDTSALGGSSIEYDNFEPWPTIDVPFTASAGTAGLITTEIRVIGTIVLVIYSAAAPFSNPAPATITRWLPGTLVTLGGQSAYTLRVRPVSVTLSTPPATDYYAYRFELLENAGTATPDTLNILEPNVANQHLPYLWGPDEFGTVFGAGDKFRPGSFYFCKNFTPDSAPDTYNQELTPPSEPIIGGEVIDGMAVAATSARWWRLIPQLGNLIQRYQPVQIPVGRGLGAPYAHCTDGKNIYFVAKDGVWMHSLGPGKSLTDADLYNLFPHEGADNPTDYVYAGFTIYAPNYAYAGDFRLAFCNSFLYFDYRDSSGFTRTLVCDLTDPNDPCWIVDEYGSAITVHRAVDQPASTLDDTSAKYALLLLADSAGNVHHQSLASNDNNIPIQAICTTFEFNGGDVRAEQLFNDAFLDIRPVSGLEAAGISAGSVVTSVKLFDPSSTRYQSNIPVGLELKYMGLLLRWTDNFSVQDIPTVIFVWQPMYQAVPVKVFHWKTQKTSFGLLAYKHLRLWNFCYRAATEVTITITAYDGTSPANLILPSTGGAVVKVLFPFTFNKGMLYDFEGMSTGEWAPYFSESELWVGMWSRDGVYLIVRDIDAPKGIRS